MSEILILKDLFTPFMTTLFGTAVGATIVTVLQNQKIEYEEMKNKVQLQNLITTQYSIYLHNLLQNLITFEKSYEYYKLNQGIYINYLDKTSDDLPHVRITRIYIGKMNFDDLRIKVSKTTNDHRILTYASHLAETFENISNSNKELHNFFDRIEKIELDGSEARAVGEYFGKIDSSKTKKIVDESYNGLIKNIRYSIKLIEIIVIMLQKQIAKEKHNYEAYNFKKLPKQFIISFSDAKKHQSFPKDDEYSLIKNIGID